MIATGVSSFFDFCWLSFIRVFFSLETKKNQKKKSYLQPLYSLTKAESIKLQNQET